MKKRKLYQWVTITLVILIFFGCAGTKFKKAQKINTIKAYDQFLKEYGDSEFASQAKKMREKVWFEEAKQLKTISGYDRYLKDYPNGTFYAEVNKLREVVRSNRAKQKNTVQSYDKYLEEYPKGTFTSKIIQKREKLWFERVKKKNTIESFEQYLKEYPNGKFLTETNQLKEKVWFENAKKENTIESYYRYLKEYPKGTFKIEALIGIGEIDLEPLINDLKDKYVEPRESAAEALGKIKDPRAIAPLIANLNLRWKYKIKTVEALVNIGEPAVEPLIKAINNKNRRISKSAIKILGKIKNPRGIIALINSLIESRLSHGIGEVIIKIGKPAVEPLIKALKKLNKKGEKERYNRQASERMHIAKILGKIKDPRAFDILIYSSSLEINELYKYVYLRALGNLDLVSLQKRNVIKLLINALDNDRDRMSSSDDLIKIGEAAVEPLIKAFKENNISRTGIVWILDNIGGRRANNFLKEILQNIGIMQLSNASDKNFIKSNENWVFILTLSRFNRKSLAESLLNSNTGMSNWLSVWAQKNGYRIIPTY